MTLGRFFDWIETMRCFSGDSVGFSGIQRALVEVQKRQKDYAMDANDYNDRLFVFVINIASAFSHQHSLEQLSLRTSFVGASPPGSYS